MKKTNPENNPELKDNKTSPRGMGDDKAHLSHDLNVSRRNVEQAETFDSAAQNAQSKQTTHRP